MKPVGRPSLGWLVAVALASLWLLVSPTAFAAPVFPVLIGRVVDQANILSPQVEGDLDARLADLEAHTSRQLVVVTVASLQGLEIEEYGYQLGRAWGIGESKRNTGVLFLVAPNDRRVRIEVGYGLEDVLTDALSNLILQERVLPKFKSGDMVGGVVDGTDALITQLALPDDQARQRVAEATGGAGQETNDWPLIIAALVVIWVVFGLIGSIGGRRGHRADAWLWPLFLLTRGGGGFGGGGGSGRGFRGGGGSFGGGGASGRW